MNKLIFFAVILFLITIHLVSATPVIQPPTVQPPYLWLGEDALISLNCFDENNTIEDVYANITGPNGYYLYMLPFTKQGENYTLLIDSLYLDRTGQYDVIISCENNNSEITYTSTNFTVSNLTGYINDINPSTVYVGDIIEIDFIVKKDNENLPSGVNFNVSLNNQLKNLKVHPAYDNNKGWILRIDSPLTSGIYDLKITAFYDRTNATGYDKIDVRNKTEFEIVSIEKNWIKYNDNVTVKLKALEKGNIIELNKNNINIKIGSVNAEITEIYRQGDTFDVKIIAPNLPSGRYKLEAYLDYDGSHYDSEWIYYIVPIAGTLVNSNNKAMSVQIEFIQNGITKLKLITDSYGHYSGNLIPDIYDIKITFPKSSLYLYDVIINSFDDPVKYFYTDSFDVPGIRNAGLYDYEIDLPYSSADIEMSYNEKNVFNENDLKVFKCSNWNSGRRVCNDEWTEINGEIDVIRNKVRITSSTLSAFVIGEIKGLKADFSLDKEKYYLNDNITIRGLVKDEDGGIVDNSTVNVHIKGTTKNYKTTTDENGIFYIEIPAPENEGEYKIVLEVKKYPYKGLSDEKTFEVVKSRSVLINFPETIKIARGENLTQEFSLLNTGQADLENLRIYFEGIPEDYCSFSKNISLKTGENRKFYVNFNIPFYADIGVSSASIKVEGNGLSEERVFGLNIFEKVEKNKTSTPTGLATGFVIPEINYNDLVYIVIFAIACFSTAMILKKLKVRKMKRDDIKKFLFDVKNFVEKVEIRPQKSDYDKIIITEFPNFLKFSERLKQLKGGDNGKNY